MADSILTILAPNIKAVDLLDNTYAIAVRDTGISVAVKVDQTAFTAGSDSVMMMGAVYDEAAIAGIAEDQAGFLRMSTLRELYVKQLALTPLAKAAQTATAELANTDILAADLSPTNTPCLFRTQVLVSVSGIFSAMVKTAGPVTTKHQFNQAVALTANSVYTFDLLVHSGDTINYQTSVGADVTLRVQEIVGAVQ